MFNNLEVTMKTNVTFRHFNASHPKLQTEAVEIANGFTKYLDVINSVDVEFINDEAKIVEFKVSVTRDVLKSSSQTDDFHKSLHDASDKMIRQLTKWKTKHFNNHHSK